MIAALLLVLIWVIGAWFQFLYQPLVTDPHGVVYTVREKSTIHAVIDDLTAQGVIQHPNTFFLVVRVKGVSHQLKAGDYLFAKGTTANKLLKQIITANGLFHRAFMIVPGWNFKEVRNALLHNEYLNHTTKNLTDTEIMTQLGRPELDPEGQFYPDTYFFRDGTDEIIVLKKAFKIMQDKLNKAWETRDPDLPFMNSYDALIAASIIEKEAYFQNELPKIAGVLVNRLKKNMLLQFDPTVIYGVGSHYTGTIRKQDLSADNPYNTYVHKGLPPTPISMPSMAAIDAVLHPTKHDYYYFVAQNNGASRFSKQLDEHSKAVIEIRKERWFFNYSLTRSYLQKLISPMMILSLNP